MSVYLGTAIEPTAVKNILYGYFLTPEKQHLVLVRPNRLDLCEYNDNSIRILREISAKGKIMASVKVKINPNDTKECVAFLTTKLQLVIYEFDENGNAEIRVHGTVEKGIGNEANSGVLMVALKKSAIIIHCRASSIEYVTWEQTNDSKKVSFVTKQFRRYAFIAGIAPIDNDDNHFAIVEKDGHSYQCHVAKEDTTNEDIQPIENYQIQDVGVDFLLVIPFDNIPGSVLAIAASKVTFISSNHSACYPVTGQQHRFICWTPLASPTRFLLADENGDLFILAVISSNDNKISDIVIEKIGTGPIPACIQRLDKGHFLVVATLGDHELLNIGRRENGDYFVESVQTISNLGPALDIISIEKRSDRKLVVSSGAFKHGSLRIIKNCMSIYTLAKLKFSYVPDVYPLNFLSSPKSLFAIRRQNGYEMLEVNEENLTVQRFSKPELFSPHFPRFESLSDTLFLGVIEPHFYVHITQKGGVIVYGGEPVATLPPCSAADVTRYGEIVISKENFVQWFRFDASRGLTKVAEQKFPRPIWNVKFADSEDPSCRLCFVIPFLSKRFFLVEVPEAPSTLNTVIKIPIVNSKIVVTPMLLNFPDWRTYVICAMDDGSVDYYQYDSTNKTIGPCGTLNVGVQPPLLCKVYVQRQLHLVLCSDQTTVMKYDKHSLGFCNMDVKDVGFMLPLSAKEDKESVNSLLYYSEGHICLGKIIDKQKMTIQKIHVGETIGKLEHDTDTNVLVALTYHSNLVTVTPNAPEKIDEPNTLVTTFETRKKIQWSASDEYHYETGAGQNPVQYLEDAYSLVIFGSDRFTILDAVEFSRFEELTCLTIVKFFGDTYVFVGTSLIFPGSEVVDHGRILVFRIDTANNRLEPSGVLRNILEKVVRGPVYAIQSTSSTVKALIGTSCFELLFNPSQNTLEIQNTGLIGHFIHCNAATFNDDLSAILSSDAMQSLYLSRLDNEKEDGRMSARERGQKVFISMDFLNNHCFIGADSQEIMSLFSDLQSAKKDNLELENAPITLPSDLINLGSIYLGQTVNKIRPGAPFLPIYAKPQKSNFNHRYFCTACGAVSVIAQIEDDLFTFLKNIEIALNKMNPVACDQITYRSSGNFPYNDAPFIDGDYLRELLAYSNPNEILQDIPLPKSLQDEKENPGLSHGLIAFNYLRQLWSLH